MEKTYFTFDKNNLGTPEYEKFILEGLRNERLENKGDINAMMDPEYVSIDWDNKKMIIKYVAKEWELNRVGVMHGGVISTILDHTAGCTSCAFNGYWTPSIDVTVKYISQINLDDKLICTGHIIHSGKRFITCEATLFNETSGRVAAQLLGTYANGASNSSANK